MLHFTNFGNLMKKIRLIGIVSSRGWELVLMMAATSVVWTAQPKGLPVIPRPVIRTPSHPVLF